MYQGNGMQPPKRKKRKDNRVELDGKRVSKYALKQMSAETEEEELSETVEPAAEADELNAAIPQRKPGEKRPDYRYEDCRESFPCAHCGKMLSPEGAGSGHRNHCPHCLHSLHVDNVPGDRGSDCHGDMEPIAVWVRDDGEWALIHRCRKCGKLSSNRVLADDNPIALMSLAVKPLANPPFPLQYLEDFSKLS